MKQKDKLFFAFYKYREAEGCSCCRDVYKHNVAEKELAELFEVPPYEDESGYDWSKKEKELRKEIDENKNI